MGRAAGSWGRAVVVCATALLVLGGGGRPADAHPFGVPPTALVSADGRRVTVEWAAAPDDAMVVGMAIGVLDDDSLDRYLEGPVQTAPPAAQEEALSASPELLEYLLERIVVAQDGEACDGRVEPIEDFMSDGARVVHDCPAPVTAVSLQVTMLHDVHTAYRTFAITEGTGRPEQAVFTVDNPEQEWDFTADGQAPLRIAWLPPVVLGVVGAIGVGAFALRRRAAGRT